MSVWRRDPTTGGWVILAPERAGRPREPTPDRERASGDGTDDDCPLCPGREADTPPEILRIPREQGQPWRLRVVPNKYPVLSPSGAKSGTERRGPLLRESCGVGHHELVVESPRHGLRMAEMSPREVTLVLDAYHRRHLDLRREPRVAHVLTFRNSGERAGASLAHPHSQIVATPMAPAALERRLARARDHYERAGRCLYRQLLDAELEAGERVVAETPGFVVLCPFASGSPFETWILPRRQRPSFASTSSSERAELGRVLRDTLAALDGALGRPDFNYVLHTAPVAEEDELFYLWHLQILPRLTALAGFELGSGMQINTRAPEEAASALRDRLQGRSSSA